MRLYVALAICALLAVASLVRLLLYARKRAHRVTKAVHLGDDATRYRPGQKLLVDGKRRKAVRVTEVDAKTGVATFEPLPPPTASERKAGPKEAALLRAMGYDPAVYDCAPVCQPWPGLQVFRGGEKVRFFTRKQVKAREREWRTALREART
jgi:hypothetical protein